MTVAQIAAKALAETARLAAVALRNDLVAQGETWTVERVERSIASVRLQLDLAVGALRIAYGATANTAVGALIEVGVGLLDIGARLNATRARVVTWSMPATGNAAMAAFWLYRDATRSREIVALNRLRDPNRIDLGTVLRVRGR